MKTKPPQIPVLDPSTRDKGDTAENIVRAYLENKGYEILDTNWYYGKYELDIIARDGEELVIVEVRSRVGEGFEHPEDAISEQKIKHIITAAEGWIQKHNWEKNTRFDLITVAIMGPDNYELNHYDYAFYPKP